MRFLGQNLSVRKVEACVWQCPGCGSSFVVMKEDLIWTETSDPADPRERGMHYVKCSTCHCKYCASGLTFAKVPIVALENLEADAIKIFRKSGSVWETLSAQEKYPFLLQAAVALLGAEQTTK